jgi:hypothetical protein
MFIEEAFDCNRACNFPSGDAKGLFIQREISL